MPDPKSYSYYCIEAQATFNYVVYAEDLRKEGPRKSLIVLLHERGQHPSDILAYKGITSADYVKQAIIVCPQGYNSRGWYGSRGDDFNDEEPDAHHHGAKQKPLPVGYYSEADVINVLGLVRNLYSIDDTRIYVMGHGMGGSGAIHLASKYPQLWAAVSVAAPDLKAIMALQLPEDVLTTMKDVPIKLFHGRNDKTTPISFTRDWVSVMKQLDMTFQFAELEAGHDISTSDLWAKESFQFFRTQARTRPAPPIIRPCMFQEPPKETDMFLEMFNRAKNKIWRSGMLNGGTRVSKQEQGVSSRGVMMYEEVIGEEVNEEDGHMWV